MDTQTHPEYDESASLVVDSTIRIAEDGAPVLTGTECTNCHYVSFPPTSFCRRCLSESVTSVDLSREGELRTYTIVRTGQEGFDPPYACGYVTLPEGVRLYSLLKGWESGGLEVGMPVNLVLDKITEDSESNEPLFGHCFRIGTGDVDD